MQVIVSEYKSILYGIISHYIRQDDKDNYFVNVFGPKCTRNKIFTEKGSN
jgi:hypothetical protein